MRILHVAHRFHPSVGGTEQAVRGLATAQVKQGHEVSVLTLREDGAPLTEEIDGITVQRMRALRLGSTRIPLGYLGRLRNGKYDVLHVHGQRVWCSDMLLAWLRHFKGRKIFTPYGFYQASVGPSPTLQEIYYRRWFARRCRHFTHIAACTAWEQHLMLEWGLPYSQVEVLPLGVDPEEFHPDGDRSCIVYAGGFYPNKQVLGLIWSLAWAKVQEPLWVFGPRREGPEGASVCEKYARDFGIDLKVWGARPRWEVVDAIEHAKILVLPSTFEGFGLVLLEAMAAGTPFVSTDVGAARQLAASGAGVVVDGVTKMGEEICRLLEKDALREIMGQRGMKAGRDYTWDRVATEYGRLYGA